MARIVKSKNFPKIFKKFNKKNLEKYKKAAESGIINSMWKLAEESPVDTGEYAKSWEYEKGKDAISVGNFAPHAAVIEFGARPFKPPIKPLLAWAKRHLKDPSQPPGYSPEVWSMARGVQKKIEEKGMKPKHVLTNTIPYITNQMKLELELIEFEEFNL